jgi:hydrogenase maturation protease
MSKPILVLGYGNPSRGDDALGPLLLDYIEQQLDTSLIEIVTDFQLQIEHALDLQNRELALFVDASVACQTAFDFAELQAGKDNSYTSHAMSPAAVLLVYQSVTGLTPPPAFLLSIQGLHFELGEDLSPEATNNLQQASRYVRQLLNQPEADVWRRQTLKPTALAC